MSTIIPGRGKSIARAVLAAADRAKVDQLLIRTVQKGYLVPDAVAEEYLKGQKKSADKTEQKSEDAAPAKGGRRSAATKAKEAKAEEAKAEEVKDEAAESEEVKDEESTEGEKSEDGSNDPEKGE